MYHRFFAAFALLTVCASLCLAWGGEGHQLVALIAEDQLTPQAKAAVKGRQHL